MTKNKMQDEENRQCSAASDYQKLQSMENNAAVRELRDKIEQLNFRLTECKSENQMLKRNLKLAKQMVCKEVGCSSLDIKDIMKHGAESSRKERTETILLLKKKVQELEEYLSQLEGKPNMAEVTPSAECAKEQIRPDRKAFWRMELERRLAREAAEKDLNPLLKEMNELRKRLEAEKTRFRELNEEVNLLRAELQSEVDRNEEDMGLTKSFQTIESQLQGTLAERAEIRRELVGSKSRNKRLEEEITALKNELQILCNKARDNNILIDSYTSKRKHIQDAIEAEKSIVQQNMDNYKTEILLLKNNYDEDIAMLDSLRNMSFQRHQILTDLEIDIYTGFLVCFKEQDKAEGTSSNNSHSSSTASNSTETKPKTNEPSEGNDAVAEDSGKQGDNKTNSVIKLKLFLEFSKYKSLLAAAQEERERLFYIAQEQDKEMNEIAKQVVETGRVIIQKNSQKNALLDEVSRLQRSLSSKRPNNVSVPAKNQLEELRIKINAQKEENDLLRNFLQTSINNRAKSFKLHKRFLLDSKNFFLDTLQDVIRVLNEKKHSSPVNSDHEEENRISQENA